MTPSGTRQKPLLNFLLQNEGDVVLARRRSRQIALLLGFDLHDQTRISTAVSELCSSAVMQGARGRLTFAKVLERTNDLLMTNDELKLARDEAIGANRLKVQFISNMSHELRTPMAGILGLAEMLANDDDNSELVQELAQNIMQAGQDLMHIVNDLLDFSKLESGKFKLDIVSFSVAELVAEVAQSISIPARAKGLTLSIDIEPAMPTVLRGDSMRLKHALQNLAQNALKFTESGTIALSAFIDSINNDLYVVRFGMVDTGIGIDLELQKQIFEPFVQGDGSNTRKYGGTGLGLSIVKQSVDMMNGHVGIKSAPGAGTEIWFTVPLTLNERQEQY